MNTPELDPATPGFVREMFLIGTLTDDHDTEYDGDTYTTPSILRDDGKENPNIGEAQR